MNTLTSHTEDYESKTLTELKAICSNVGVSIYGTKKAILNRLVKNGTIKLKPTIEVKLSLNSKKDDIVSACRRRNLPVTGNKNELLARVKNFDSQQGQGNHNNQKVTIQKVHLGERTNGNNGNVLKRVYNKHSDPLSVGVNEDISIIVDEDESAAKRRKTESPNSFESVLSGIFEKKNDSILPDEKEKIVTMETDPERFDESGTISLKEGLNIRRWASDKYFDVKVNVMDVGDVVKDIRNKFEDVSSESNQTISRDHSAVNVETNDENGLQSSKDLKEDSCIILNHEKNESNSQMDAEDDPLSNEITCDDPLANEVNTNDPLSQESDDPKINEDLVSQVNNNIDSKVTAIDEKSEEECHFIGPNDDNSKTKNTTDISTGDKILNIELANEETLGNETTEIIINEDKMGTISSENIESSTSENDSANAATFQSDSVIASSLTNSDPENIVNTISDSENVTNPNCDSEYVANSQSDSDSEKNGINSPSKSDFEIAGKSPCKNDFEISARSPSKNEFEISVRSPTKNDSENVTFSPSKSESENVARSQSNNDSEIKENSHIEESEHAEDTLNDEHLNLETPESNGESDNYEVSHNNFRTDNYHNENSTEDEITAKVSDEKDLGGDKESECAENDDNHDTEDENSMDSDNESTASDKEDSDTEEDASDNEDSDEDVEMEEPEEENDETVVSVCSKKSEITFNYEKADVNVDIIDILNSIISDATEETKIEEIKPIKSTFFAFGLFVTSSGSAEKVKFVA